MHVQVSFLEKTILSPPIPLEEIEDMAVCNEVEPDIQNNDSEGGIDNRGFGKFLFAIII